MRTGLTKRQKTTEIFFAETKSRITVYTYNTDLKKRLTAYAEQYPDHCTMTEEDNETGYKAFEIEKERSDRSVQRGTLTGGKQAGKAERNFKCRY